MSACYRVISGVLALLAVAACTDHAYVALQPGEPLRDINLLFGGVTTIPSPAGGTPIVGLAYDEAVDHLYARVLPGTQLREVDRRSGHVLRAFSAQRVVPGCGGIDPGSEFPNLTCGLALRQADKHLFLDHPNGNPITEVDTNGVWVRDIMLQPPGGTIGGLAYDDVNGRLFVLYIPSRSVAEVDLQGRELRRIVPQAPIQPRGLEYDRRGGRLLIPLIDGNFLGVFDLSGRLIRQHALNRSGITGGTGGGRRWTTR